MWYKVQKVQKYALNSQLQALQILTNDDELENWSLSSFLLAVNRGTWLKSVTINHYQSVDLPLQSPEMLQLLGYQLSQSSMENLIFHIFAFLTIYDLL